MDSFRISLESFRSFRGPLLYKPVTGQELFFALSYSKLCLKAFALQVPYIFDRFLDGIGDFYGSATFILIFSPGEALSALTLFC